MYLAFLSVQILNLPFVHTSTVNCHYKSKCSQILHNVRCNLASHLRVNMSSTVDRLIQMSDLRLHTVSVRQSTFVRANGPCEQAPRSESRLVSAEGWQTHASDWSNSPFSQTNADPSGVGSRRREISLIRTSTRYTLAGIELHSCAVKGEKQRNATTRRVAPFGNTRSSGCKLHTRRSQRKLRMREQRVVREDITRGFCASSSGNTSFVAPKRTYLINQVHCDSGIKRIAISTVTSLTQIVTSFIYRNESRFITR